MSVLMLSNVSDMMDSRITTADANDKSPQTLSVGLSCDEDEHQHLEKESGLREPLKDGTHAAPSQSSSKHSYRTRYGGSYALYQKNKNKAKARHDSGSVVTPPSPSKKKKGKHPDDIELLVIGNIWTSSPAPPRPRSKKRKTKQSASAESSGGADLFTIGGNAFSLIPRCPDARKKQMRMSLYNNTSENTPRILWSRPSWNDTTQQKHSVDSNLLLTAPSQKKEEKGDDSDDDECNPGNNIDANKKASSPPQEKKGTSSKRNGVIRTDFESDVGNERIRDIDLVIVGSMLEYVSPSSPHPRNKRKKGQSTDSSDDVDLFTIGGNAFSRIPQCPADRKKQMMASLNNKKSDNIPRILWSRPTRNEVRQQKHPLSWPDGLKASVAAKLYGFDKD